MVDYWYFKITSILLTYSAAYSISELPMGWMQEYMFWSIDRSLRRIFQHLENARSGNKFLGRGLNMTAFEREKGKRLGNGKLKKYLFACICMCTCVPRYAHGGQRITHVLGSLFLPCRAWGLN